MNKQAETAFNQYKDLVTAWGRDVNLEAWENGCQLIKWIEDQKTASTLKERQDVKVTNWESLLSGFPTEAITDEIRRRISIKQVHEGYTQEYPNESIESEIQRLFESEAQGTISSDNPVCPGCGQYMTIEKTGNGRFEAWSSHCDCIIGSEIAVPYQSTREEVIRVQNEAILRYQGK